MKTQIAAKFFALILAATVVAAPSIASAAPLPGIFHMHPRVPDTRIHYTVFNRAELFYEVRIDGKVYAILPHHVLNITAPAGTQVYAAMDKHNHKNGSLLRELSSADDSKMLILY